MRFDLPRFATALTLVLTVGQLAVATFVPGLPQFEGKAFGARLAAYPVMMLALPVVWLGAQRLRPGVPPLAWAGVAFVMLPFLIDVTGNTLDLYDRVEWWDDANHFVNWFSLCLGIGLVLRSATSLRPWALAAMVTGIGAVLAILWEVGEYYAFIRGGTELETAYTDTLGDEALGTLGGTLAGLVVASFRSVRSR